ncbi:MAG: SDR family oxidoreductase [Micavibrio sp.]|nr:SDR family oxidoreductase [Micavibrio sp.]
MQRFTGKTVLVTGGNSGIGLATAQRIIDEGGKVIITGRDEATLQQAEKSLGENAEAVKADVGKLADIDRLMAHIGQKYRTIDGLFANAGIAEFKPIDQVTENDFDSMFDINVKGVFFTLQKAIPLLAEGSAVVINASVAGSMGGGLSSVYGATKAAVRSMARTFSGAYVSRGLRFNAVSPGPIDTPIWGRMGNTTPEQVKKTKDGRAEMNPMKRMGTVDEVTAAIAFLLSPESSYILGAELFVDGGVTQL